MTKLLYIHDNKLGQLVYKTKPLRIIREISLNRWRNKIKAWNIRVLSDYRRSHKNEYYS